MAQSKNPNLITPLETGRLLGVGQDTIRYWMRTEQFPVGKAFRNEETGRWSYIIPREALMDWICHYRRTLPVSMFTKWLIGDAYIIPRDELKTALQGKAVLQEITV